MPLEDFIIYVYCCVVENYEELTKERPLRKCGYNPKLSDSEVITMEIVGEFMGKDQDKSMWQYFQSHWKPWFPNLGSRSNFAKQCANLWKIKEQIARRLVAQMGGDKSSVHSIDGFPIPVCKRTRAGRSRCFKNEAGYSYCAAKEEKYYGFKGHLVISSNGIITNFAFANASVDERDVADELTQGIIGVLLGDKGYIRPYLYKKLLKRRLELQTPLRKNMTDSRCKKFVGLLMRIRRRIETVIGQLTERFHIQKVRARDSWHLCNRLNRKILAHLVCSFINTRLSRPAIQFDGLVQI
jgi:hypothetical protein